MSGGAVEQSHRLSFLSCPQFRRLELDFDYASASNSDDLWFLNRYGHAWRRAHGGPLDNVLRDRHARRLAGSYIRRQFDGGFSAGHPGKWQLVGGGFGTIGRWQLQF